MIPRHLFCDDDVMWFLDHGRRRYRVTPLDHDDEGYAHALRIATADGSDPTVIAVRSGLSPDMWEDSDAYAAARLDAIAASNANRPARNGGAR
jgi:hypothetical protein